MIFRKPKITIRAGSNTIRLTAAGRDRWELCNSAASSNFPNLVPATLSKPEVAIGPFRDVFRGTATGGRRKLGYVTPEARADRGAAYERGRVPASSKVIAPATMTKAANAENNFVLRNLFMAVLLRSKYANFKDRYVYVESFKEI